MIVLYCCMYVIVSASAFYFDFFCFLFFFFFKQKTAYEMRISDWSSDVCSSDLNAWNAPATIPAVNTNAARLPPVSCPLATSWTASHMISVIALNSNAITIAVSSARIRKRRLAAAKPLRTAASNRRSEEHTSELQSLMRTSYAVFCLKTNKKKRNIRKKTTRREIQKQNQHI